MKKINLVSYAFVTFFSAAINGQDPHFSQYFASPLTLNPAMTGYFKGDYRLNTNFRQQWWGVGAPFTTNTFGFDTKLMQTKVNKNDVFAVGILGLIDQSQAGAFKSLNLSASVAYHKALDADAKNNIGIGFQFSYASRSININALDFATQFNGSGFDTGLPSYEIFGSQHRNYLDINTGILYTYKSDKTELYFGGSLYHTTRPNTSFLKNESFSLPMRYSFHAGSRFTVNENEDELFIGGLFMQQAEATEKNIGVAYGFNLKNDKRIYAGSWYRFDDAILPYLGIEFNDFKVGLSYDILNSSLKSFKPKNGSFELSLNLLVTKPVNNYTNYKGGRIF